MTVRGRFSAASRPTRRGTSNCCARPIAGPPSSTGVCRSTENMVILLANAPPPLSPCRQQVLYGTLPKGATRGPIPEETEADGPAEDLTESRRGSRASGGGVSVIGQSGGGATSGQVQGGQLRRSQDGRISLR